ncbi:hypothetical protein SLS58_003782 [Diplodia intermedia]|uniref:Uncharacterized protein n=1 Tax=Diplodia intermedia TaxID=856260 RepID=A0ABR3TVH0_9PEZI
MPRLTTEHSDSSLRESVHFEHLSTARGPLADFARTPLYPPPVASPVSRPCRPLPDGTCNCGAGPSTIHPPAFAQLAAANGPVNTVAYCSNPFTGAEPDYSSIRPMRAPAVTRTFSEHLGESPGTLQDPSPSSDYTDDDDEVQYPETTRRPTPVDQAQAEINRMLHARRTGQSAGARLAVLPILHRRIGSPSGEEDGEFEPHYPETTRRPTPLDQAQAEVNRMLRAQGTAAVRRLSPARLPSLSTAPEIMAAMSVQPLRVGPGFHSSDDAEGNVGDGGSGSNGNSYRPNGNNVYQVHRAIIPYIGPLGTILPFPPLLREWEEEELEEALPSPTASTRSSVILNDTFYVRHSSASAWSEVSHYSNYPAERSDSDRPAQPLPELGEPFPPFPFASPRAVPPVLQPPHPAATSGAADGSSTDAPLPMPMWQQALAFYDVSLADSSALSDDAIVHDFLAAARATDVERRRLVSFIVTTRSALTERRGGSANLRWSDCTRCLESRQLSNAWHRSRDGDDVWCMVAAINVLWEHDRYHWPMLPVLEYGDADGIFERQTPRRYNVMDRVYDWNPLFLFEDPFAPRFDGSDDDSAEDEAPAPEDEAPVSPRTIPAGDPLGEAWDRDGAASHAGGSYSPASMSPVPPETHPDEGWNRNFSWSQPSGTARRGSDSYAPTDDELCPVSPTTSVRSRPLGDTW